MSIPVVRFLGTLARIGQRHHFQESNLLQKQAASGKLPCARQRAAPTCGQAPAGQSPWCYHGAAAPMGTADKGFWGSAPELGFSSVYVIGAPSRLNGAACGDCAKPDPTHKSHPPKVLFLPAALQPLQELAAVTSPSLMSLGQGKCHRKGASNGRWTNKGC